MKKCIMSMHHPSMGGAFMGVGSLWLILGAVYRLVHGVNMDCTIQTADSKSNYENSETMGENLEIHCSGNQFCLNSCCQEMGWVATIPLAIPPNNLFSLFELSQCTSTDHPCKMQWF